MKKSISIILALLLLVASTVNSFADTSSSTYPVVSNDLSLNIGYPSTLLRGANIPSTTVPLYAGVSSSGSASFYYGVYSNYKYSNHGGSIKITYTNSSEYSGSTHQMSINLYTGNYFTQTYVGSISCSVNSSGSYTFTGLDTSKSYYFWFYQGNYEFETTTDFTVTRGN